MASRSQRSGGVAQVLAWIATVLGVIVVVGLVTLGVVYFNPSLVPNGAMRHPDPSDISARTDPSATPEQGIEDPAPEAVSGGQPVAISHGVDQDWIRTTSEATGIPQRALAAYSAADIRVRESENCAVGWNTLAAIGYVETHHGTLHGGTIERDGVARPEIRGIRLDGSHNTAVISDSDEGALDGDTEFDRAVGPMQFIPQTWATWGSDGSGDGVADIHNVDDAAYTAARYLCYTREGLESADAWIAGIRSYNNSIAYQNEVARIASFYSEQAAIVEQ